MASIDSIAIILASGSGRRFGSETPKQFIELQGVPLLVWTLRAFEAASKISAYAVVVAADYVDSLSDWSERYQLSKLKWVVAGGAERQDSMANGFRAVPRADQVLVHDGARLLVTPELIDRVVTAAMEKGAAVPGQPMSETLKKVSEGGHVLTTVDRTDYATIQTPQGFRHAILDEAIKEAQADNFYGTDEAMLVERMGFPVCMVPGQSDNIKVTTPEDRQYVEWVLSTRGQ